MSELPSLIKNVLQSSFIAICRSGLEGEPLPRSLESGNRLRIAHCYYKFIQFLFLLLYFCQLLLLLLLLLLWFLFSLADMKYLSLHRPLSCRPEKLCSATMLSYVDKFQSCSGALSCQKLRSVCCSSARLPSCWNTWTTWAWQGFQMFDGLKCAHYVHVGMCTSVCLLVHGIFEMSESHREKFLFICLFCQLAFTCLSCCLSCTLSTFKSSVHLLISVSLFWSTCRIRYIHIPRHSANCQTYQFCFQPTDVNIPVMAMLVQKGGSYFRFSSSVYLEQSCLSVSCDITSCAQSMFSPFCGVLRFLSPFAMEV